MPLQECALNLDQSRRELASHGTADFPCAGYCTVCTDQPGDEIAWHYHEEMEFIYIKKGALKVITPADETVVPEGSGIWINSGILHYACADPACELHSMVFSIRLLAADSSSAIARKYLIPLQKCTSLESVLMTPQDPAERKLLHRFEQAFTALRSDADGYELQVHEILFSICSALCSSHRIAMQQAPQDAPTDSLRLQRMLDYIHAHSDQPLHLADLSDDIGVSTREIMRCFQRVLHVSPVQYALKYRITESAAELAHRPGKSISEVAIQYGFDNPSYYARLFRRYFRCSPAAYRARLRTQASI